MCPTRTHPTLEKPGAQNIEVFENQGKQRVLSDHRKSIKTSFLEKTNRGRKKDDRNTSFNKRFYILKNQIYRKYPNLVRI